ncbi:hypothetical protein EMGBS6_17710 [Opitutia bacterium]|nr:hypothetical protein EMGBS6_17710 [Opitutae bacterium]
MQNFASQCLDQTKALLKLNFNSLSADGTVVPVEGEVSRADEPGHAALAFGEYFRATGELHLDRQNIAEIVARTITAQVRISKGSDNGMAFACLGLLAFGPTANVTQSGKSSMKPRVPSSTSASPSRATIMTTSRPSISPRLSVASPLA